MPRWLWRQAAPTFAKLLEEEAIELHMIAMSATPPIFYLAPKTWEIINKIGE
ncbi:MAG: hypothetical protein FJ044_00560 [Candidatus Cloacimonetes bacterium]|nr:hypothetical protein [Candidatus Cloacimonadota bacterium]